MTCLWFSFALVVLAGTILLPGAAAQMPNAGNYDSIQAALDAHPNRVVFVPQADHYISEALRLTTDGSGLIGYGRILQSNPDAPILIIEQARDVRVSDLTFTRTKEAMPCNASGIVVENSHNVLLNNIRIIDNQAQPGALRIVSSEDVRVTNAEIRNYKRIAVDDRTAPGETLYGYAFHCIDGTGIEVRQSRNIALLHNRIIEDRLLPTREIKEAHQLGSLTPGRYPNNFGELGRGAEAAGYVSNWHQGSAILVTGPETTRDVLIHGNHIENCAQGIDLHADYVRCTDNTVIGGMMGIKMTHGSRHLVVANNLLSRIDLWAILYNPGAISHAGKGAEGEQDGAPPNIDGGTVIANNIITDYGYGHEYWNWSHPPSLIGSYPIAIFEGQLPENPPVRDLIITGNLVYDTGRDKILRDGKLVEEGPRYRYALYLGPWQHGADPGPSFPRNVRIHGNVFHPGVAGVSNLPIEETAAPR